MQQCQCTIMVLSCDQHRTGHHGRRFANANAVEHGT